jgi:hypothetical protein
LFPADKKTARHFALIIKMVNGVLTPLQELKIIKDRLRVYNKLKLVENLP